jgi:hypothetical protein
MGIIKLVLKQNWRLRYDILLGFLTLYNLNRQEISLLTPPLITWLNLNPWVIWLVLFLLLFMTIIIEGLIRLIKIPLNTNLVVDSTKEKGNSSATSEMITASSSQHNNKTGHNINGDPKQPNDGGIIQTSPIVCTKKVPGIIKQSFELKIQIMGKWIH